MEQALAQTGDFLRTVVRHLHVTEFDQLRMASTTCRDLCLPLERQVLRLSFNRLSIAGEWTRLAMRDIMLPNQWSTLRNLVGWVADGWAGESIDALFQRLAEVTALWDEVQPAAQDYRLHADLYPAARQQ